MSDELDHFFPRPKPVNAAVLGAVVSGSLSKGLEVKLSHDRLIEGLAVGRYVVVHGQTGRRFFGMITDVVLESRHPEVEQSPPEDPDGFLARVYRGILTYGRVHVTPMLVLDEAGAARPAKTVPAHFTHVYDATPEEVAEIFGDADAPGHFYIGEPLEMEGRLFQKFVTGDYDGQGSGLGLTFCRMVVEAHGEKIWLSSPPGKGATFIFTLPLATV